MHGSLVGDRGEEPEVHAQRYYLGARPVLVIAWE